MAQPLSADMRHHMLEQMLEVRYTEERIQELFLENVIRGTTHLCIGQEAVSVGMAAVIDAKRGDTVTCTYRGHGHALALGMPLKTMMAEMMGKAAGCSKGKGGSMHLTDMSVGLIGTFAIVGAGLPVTNGAALTAQIKKTGAVSISIFGDGTPNIVAWHEAVNLAAVWKLPAVFICENNLYGEYSAYGDTAPVANVADRACAYNIPGVIVDGQDAEAVHACVKQAVERARAGEGPTLIEAKTYRYKGHSRSDPAAYRPKGELEQWLARDPITILSERMIADGQLTNAQLEAMRKTAQDEVQEATQWALDQPY
ncbi:MAG: thiamine pyrophosphate-dependent dehydrogenase E1 component subunit alpha, partial [Anaerolineae bacterium]|nr:thiamine pyrophosphate-dependent dehydrogenase E1 component subunit alpha [Anaerolineae bacterium]